MLALQRIGIERRDGKVQKHEFVVHAIAENGLENERDVEGNKQVVCHVPLSYAVQAEKFGMPLMDSRIIIEDEPEVLRVKHEKVLPNQTDVSALVSEALDRVTPVQGGVFGKERQVLIHTMRNNDKGDAKISGKIKIKGGTNLCHEQLTEVGVRAGKNRGMLQDMSDNHALNTTIERYSKIRRPKMTKAEKETRANGLYRALKKMIKPGVVDGFSKEEHGMKTVENISKICDKMNYPVTEVYGSNEHSVTGIKCFPKKQLKCKTDIGSHDADMMLKEEDGIVYVKGGQMVSAQSKEINQLCGPLVGCVQDLWHKLLRPEYRYCLGEIGRAHV